MKLLIVLVIFLASGAAQNVTEASDGDLMNATDTNSTLSPTSEASMEDSLTGNSTDGMAANSTEPPEPNECSNLEPGDIQFFMLNSDPIDQLSLFPITDIAEAVGKLFVTDRAWDGNSSFVTDEGTFEYTIGEGGLSTGDIFGFGGKYPDDKGSWEFTGTFDLSTSVPDNLFVYCLDVYEEPHFLLAVTYNGNFSDPNLDSYSFSETALPEEFLELEYGSLALPFFPNFLYRGRGDGRVDQLLESFSDPANYEGSLMPFELDLPDTTTSGANSKTISFMVALECALLGTMLVL